MRSRTLSAVACAAALLAVSGPHAALAAEDPDGDPAVQQAAAADEAAADLARRFEQAQSEYGQANARWSSADRAAFGAQRAAEQAQDGADEATRTAGKVASDAYKGGMVDDMAPLLAIIDPDGAQQDLRAVQNYGRLADLAGQDALDKKARAATKKGQARKARLRLAGLTAALTDAEARLAAVRAEQAGAQLRTQESAALVDPKTARRNKAAAAAWLESRLQAQEIGIPTFTAEQLRTRHLPKGIVRVKKAPGVAKFRYDGQWIPALPNETVEAISYSVGALGAGYVWQEDPGTDCVRITEGAWQLSGANLAGLAADMPLRRTKTVQLGDQVFLANDLHGLYQTGVAVDDSHMIAADARSGSVTVVEIEQDDVWRVARPAAPGSDDAAAPEGSEPWRCGDDPLGRLGELRGTPRQIIEQTVLRWSMQHGFPDVTPAHVLASNSGHGPTVSGGRSDHQGPGEYSWAADISNGGSPTPEMDRLARTLATAFGMPWTGSGVTQVEKDGYSVQMLYRTDVGGNHFNHVHIGIHRTDMSPVPPAQF